MRLNFTSFSLDSCALSHSCAVYRFSGGAEGSTGLAFVPFCRIFTLQDSDLADPKFNISPARRAAGSSVPANISKRKSYYFDRSLQTASSSLHLITVFSTITVRMTRANIVPDDRYYVSIVVYGVSINSVFICYLTPENKKTGRLLWPHLCAALWVFLSRDATSP